MKINSHASVSTHLSAKTMTDLEQKTTGRLVSQNMVVPQPKKTPAKTLFPASISDAAESAVYVFGLGKEHGITQAELADGIKAKAASGELPKQVIEELNSVNSSFTRYDLDNNGKLSEPEISLISRRDEDISNRNAISFKSMHAASPPAVEVTRAFLENPELLKNLKKLGKGDSTGDIVVAAGMPLKAKDAVLKALQKYGLPELIGVKPSDIQLRYDEPKGAGPLYARLTVVIPSKGNTKSASYPINMDSRAVYAAQYADQRTDHAIVASLKQQGSNLVLGGVPRASRHTGLEVVLQDDGKISMTVSSDESDHREFYLLQFSADGNQLMLAPGSNTKDVPTGKNKKTRVDGKTSYTPLMMTALERAKELVRYAAFGDFDKY